MTEKLPILFPIHLQDNKIHDVLPALPGAFDWVGALHDSYPFKGRDQRIAELAGLAAIRAQCHASAPGSRGRSN